jgi:ATP synthase protein I
MSHRDDSTQDDDAKRLQNLERRLHERSAERAAREGRKPQAQMGALGAAWRMSVELVVALFVGGLVGLGLDRLLNTAPWIMVVGIMLGFAAGVRNAVRSAYAMQVPPTGEAVAPDRDEED